MLYHSYLKPLADFLVALLLLIIFSPLIFLIILILLITNKGEIFFLQIRPGYHSKPFVIIKFKTMKDGFDEQKNALPDEQRITGIGRFIRRWSLDELLQLINVLKGDMSLVGPRPLLMQYLPYYSTLQSQRHHVMPGITGLAQVNGRNAISWEEKFDLDITYVQKQSFLLDLEILVKTMTQVFKKRGTHSLPIWAPQTEF